MKVIILAAGQNKNIDFKKPKCLLPFRGATILENQINVLNFCGIKKEDVILVIGGHGKEWTKKNIEEIKKIHSNIVINTKNLDTKNSFSLFLAVKNLKEDIVSIDGDVIFKEETIKELLETKDKNVLVSRIAYSISEKGGKLELNNNKIIQMGEFLQPSFYPWYIYSGIIKFNRKVLKDLKLLLQRNPKKDVIDNVNYLLNKYCFCNLDYFPIGIDNKVEHSNGRYAKLIGGSYAKLQRCVIVRKEAKGKGVKKLENEIKWLQSIPKDVKNKFTNIRNYKVDNDYAWFEMDYYNLPCLRELLLKGEINAQKSLYFIEKILDFMFKQIYTRKVRKNKEAWVWDKHITRVNYRLLQIRKEAPIFNKIMNAENIALNGVKYKNIPFLIKEICERPSLLRRIEPEYLRMIHGDLHFQNILINPNDYSDFILADPRGELCGGDFYYDMGKLWHSFNGLYDFLHTDMFNLEFKIVNNIVQVNLKYSFPKILREYKIIKKCIPQKLKKYSLIKQDQDWELKILFAEAMHFSSVMPFHLKNDGKEERAIAMYFTAVKLLNEFFERFKIEKISKEKQLINVNSNQDYLDLLESKNLQI
jgi:choline kinase